jgi:hypothetical protein
MKKLFLNIILINILLIISLFSFADTNSQLIILDEVVELEYGTQADSDFTDYELSVDFTGINKENLLFISSNPGVVSVNSQGHLKSRNYGQGVITVKDSLTGLEDSIEVKVFLVGDDLTPLSGPVRNTPYMTGYPDGKFSPETFIKRGEVATIFARLLEMNLDYPGKASFKDIQESDWYFPQVQAVARADIFFGDEKGNFRPEAFITRAELASAIDQYYKYNRASIILDKQNIIYDVLDDYWAKSSIYKVIKTEVMSLEQENKFLPEDFVKRLEAVEIFNRLTGRKAFVVSQSEFKDVSEEDDYFGEVEAATKEYFLKYE